MTIPDIRGRADSVHKIGILDISVDFRELSVETGPGVLGGTKVASSENFMADMVAGKN